MEWNMRVSASADFGRGLAPGSRVLPEAHQGVQSLSTHLTDVGRNCGGDATLRRFPHAESCSNEEGLSADITEENYGLRCAPGKSKRRRTFPRLRSKTN